MIFTYYLENWEVFVFIYFFSSPVKEKNCYSQRNNAFGIYNDSFGKFFT